MNLFFIYNRDIHQDDSGASRTIIIRENYLARQPGIVVYTGFRHLSPVDSRIIEIPVGKPTVENVRKIVCEKQIDILCVPEGELFAGLAHSAVQGTSCKVVTEFHNKPGYLLDTLLLEIKVNLLHSGNFLLRFKSLIKYISYPFYKSYIKKSNLKRFQEAYLLADKFVQLSPTFFGQYQNLYRLPDAKKMVAIGNPVTFSRNATIEDVKRKDNIVLIVARLDEKHKRLSLALKSWAKVEKQNPSWMLQIVGTGNDERMYKEMVRRLGLQRVEFEGRQDPEKYYTRASIFLMTSAIEGWGMTIVEAQQKGCVPIVMDSFTALHDIIEDGGNGIIVPPDSVDDMSQAIQNLIDDKSKRDIMALNAIESTERFNIEIIGGQWIDLFNSVLLCHEPSKG